MGRSGDIARNGGFFMSVANPNVHRDPWDDELDLRELIRVIVKRRGLIAGLIAVSVAIAAFLSFIVLPEVYQSEATLQLPVEVQATGSQYSLDALAAMGTSPALFGRLAERLPGSDPAQLARAVNVSLEGQARLLRVRAEAGTGPEAHALLTAWTDEFIRTVSESLEQVAREHLAVAESELEARRAELEAAQEALTAFQASHAVSLVQAQLADLESELLRATERIRQLELYTLPADRDRLAYLEAELARHPQTLDVDSTQSAVVVPLGQDQHISVEGGAVLNPTYLHLQQALVETSERLMVNLSQLERLQAFVVEAPQQIDVLRTELAQLQAEAKRLESALASAQQHYSEAEKIHAQALQAVAVRGADVPRVVSEATLPTSPVRPRKMLNIALAAFLAAFVGVGLTFVLEIWQSGDPSEGAAHS